MSTFDARKEDDDKFVPNAKQPQCNNILSLSDLVTNKPS